MIEKIIGDDCHPPRQLKFSLNVYDSFTHVELNSRSVASCLIFMRVNLFTTLLVLGPVAILMEHELSKFACS